MNRAIDHVVIAVQDLDEAAHTFETAGFTLTPRADHPFGTANRLIVTAGNYVELVSVTVPELIPFTGFAAQISRMLTGGDTGIAFVVLRSDDAAADHASLGDEAAGEILAFERPAPQVSGETTRAAFSVVFTKGERVFYCQHHTPEAIWNEGAMTHANGAQRLTGVGFDAGQPLEGVTQSDTPGITFDAGTRVFSVAGLTVRY